MSAIATKERPILFRPEMVRAILDGRKTQTRRIIKPQPHDIDNRDSKDVNEAWQSGFIDVACPYGNRGDRLWVRETFMIDSFSHYTPEGGQNKATYGVEYKAGGPERGNGSRFFSFAKPQPGPHTHDHWMPSIFMPRWASRITLEVTGVRVERLNEISEEDAKAEGMTGAYNTSIHGATSYREPFVDGFRKMHKLKPFDNPWLWVIDFKVQR